MEFNKILVIDDEKPTLKMFRLFLHVYGFQVFTAESGVEGLEIFDREQPDIVLTDIKMPGMDGLEVLQAIKKRSPSTEVIVITGHGDMDLAIEALNLDAADFINKPIQRQNLEQGLKRAQKRLNLAKSRRENMGVHQEGNVLILDIQHSVGSHCESFLREAYARAVQDQMARLVLNFGPQASINGAGFSILGQLIDDSRQDNMEVVLVGLADNFYNILEIMGLAPWIKRMDSVDLACC